MENFQNITWLLFGLSFGGVVLNVKKRKECFILWGVGNTGWIFIDFQQGLPAQAAMFVVYLATCFWGYYEWRREESLTAKAV
jgi:nicotinamide riboside transporter PnuC